MLGPDLISGDRHTSRASCSGQGPANVSMYCTILNGHDVTHSMTAHVSRGLRTEDDNAVRGHREDLVINIDDESRAV